MTDLRSDNTTIQDRAYIEQMKADILRLAEEAAYEDDEEDAEGGRDVAFEDELGDDSGVKVRDGEGSDDDDDSGAENAEIKPVRWFHYARLMTSLTCEQTTPAAPETILELAYIRDPKLFDRDAQTRRSKGRAELKTQTGWSDEQIEGWRIMLERNVCHIRFQLLRRIAHPDFP